MNFSLAHKTILLSLLVLWVSCSPKKEISQEYTIINSVLDSVIKVSRHDSIGLNLTPINHQISKEIILNPGLHFYENGKAVNKCPENNIASEQFSNLKYETFKLDTVKLDITQITNTYINTDFTLKKRASKKKLDIFYKYDNGLNKQEATQYLWEIERNQLIYQISRPIFSNDNHIAVVFVVARNHGVQSWTLKYVDSETWHIFCVEQITYE
ncbi:hypothetical protein [uncultured Kordia sp.]|uniref:hypothetical protein n=1 Tax=uncultured Kordia sp. TaxID=507699 RepID=UPI00262D66B9|nr:hypothetical protein [uncultured Kordia sp.]